MMELAINLLSKCVIMPVSTQQYSIVPHFFKLILRLGIDVSLRSGSPPGTFDHANIRTKSKKSLFISSDSTKKESWYGSTMSPIDRCDSPEPMYCTGNCRDNPSEEGLSADIVGVLQMFITFSSILMVIRF